MTGWTFVGKVMSLLFNMLSRLVITFLPRSKCLLISWQQSPSAVILEPPKIKSVTVSIVSPFICHEVMGPDAMMLVFQRLSFKPSNAVLGYNLKNDRVISFHFQATPFNITVIQVYAPTTAAKEAKVEQSYDDLIELTLKKDVFFIIGN